MGARGFLWFLVLWERTEPLTWPKGKKGSKDQGLTHACIFPSQHSICRGTASHSPHFLPDYQTRSQPLREMQQVHSSPVFMSHLLPSLTCLHK